MGEAGGGDAPPRARVPVGDTVAEAYRGVFGRPGLLLELAWLPLLVMLAAALLPDFVGLNLPVIALSPLGESAGLPVRDLVEALVAVLALNAFAVRWHHAVLFANAGGVPPGLFLRAWGRFLLYMLGLYLASAAPVALAVAGAALAGVGLALPGLVLIPAAVSLLAFRWSLLLPAAAYGRPLGLGEAWRQMRGNTWRLVACSLAAGGTVVMGAVLIFAAILSAAHIGLTDPLPEPVPPGLLILRALVDTIADFILVALGASILAAFYRRLVLRSPR